MHISYLTLLCSERRRQQLEARALNMRNSVSGGEIRARTSSLSAFRPSSTHTSNEQNWPRDEVRQSNRWGPQVILTTPHIRTHGTY